MARCCAIDLELELGALSCCRHATHGFLGKEEGSEVQKGVWEQVSEEEICYVAGNLVNEHKGEFVLVKNSCPSNFVIRRNKKAKIARYIHSETKGEQTYVC